MHPWLGWRSLEFTYVLCHQQQKLTRERNFSLLAHVKTALVNVSVTPRVGLAPDTRVPPWQQHPVKFSFPPNPFSLVSNRTKDRLVRVIHTTPPTWCHAIVDDRLLFIQKRKE